MLVELVAQSHCQGYLYFGSREKYFIVRYGILIGLIQKMPTLKPVH